MNCKYTMLRDGRPYASANTLKELVEITGIPYSTIAHGMRFDRLIHKKYKVIKNEIPIELDYEEIEEPGLPKPYNQWDEVVAPFKNVKWVKKGGRKLAVQKRD